MMSMCYFYNLKFYLKIRVKGKNRPSLNSSFTRGRATLRGPCLRTGSWTISLFPIVGPICHFWFFPAAEFPALTGMWSPSLLIKTHISLSLGHNLDHFICYTPVSLLSNTVTGDLGYCPASLVLSRVLPPDLFQPVFQGDADELEDWLLYSSEYRIK